MLTLKQLNYAPSAGQLDSSSIIKLQVIIKNFRNKKHQQYIIAALSDKQTRGFQHKNLKWSLRTSGLKLQQYITIDNIIFFHMTTSKENSNLFHTLNSHIQNSRMWQPH